MATWEDVRAAVAALPDTSEPTPRTWRAHGKPLVWERPLRAADHEALGAAAPTGDILGSRTAGLEGREEWLRSCPAVFVTPHFDGYPAVLVELARIEPDDLRELVLEAWLTQAPKRAAQAWLDEHRE